MSNVKFPGGADSIAEGCICVPRDGEAQDSEIWPEWKTRNCPLHDPNTGTEIPKVEQPE